MATSWILLAAVLCASAPCAVRATHHRCASSLEAACTGGWRSFLDRAYIYCARSSGDQALLYARCDGCAPATAPNLVEKQGTYAKHTFDEALCKKGNDFAGLHSGSGLFVYCAIHVDMKIPGNAADDVADLLRTLNDRASSLTITQANMTADRCEYPMQEPFVGERSMGVEFANRTTYSEFLNLTQGMPPVNSSMATTPGMVNSPGVDDETVLCVNSRSNATAICQAGLAPDVLTQNGLDNSTSYAVLRYRCDKCALNISDPSHFNPVTMEPRRNILFRRFKPDDDGPAKGSYYNRISTQAVFTALPTELYARIVEYCADCTSYSAEGNESIADLTDVYVRRGNHYFDQTACFLLGAPYEAAGGAVFANVTMPVFGTKPGGLYCAVFYAVTDQQLDGIPLLNYVEEEESGTAAVSASLALTLALSVACALLVR